MSVPEQIPYVGYVANGQTTEFPITFDLHDPEYLIVTVNKEIPVVGTYTVDMNALKVVFATAPTDGTQVELYRETELNRDTNYQKYDNSFRPEAVNYDFDKIWHVLQEQDMIDAELLARLKTEIEWRRTHDANFDELAKMRDAQIFSGLKGYVDTLYSASNPNIFEGVTAGIVFALDKKSVQTHLEIIYEQLKNNHSELDERLIEEVERATVAEQELNNIITDAQNNIIEEKNRAIGVEENLQLQISTGNAGIKYFSTEAEVLAFTPGAEDPKQAYAFDTKKNYLWDGSTWKDEGVTQLDLAKDFYKQNKDTIDITATTEKLTGYAMYADGHFDVAASASMFFVPVKTGDQVTVTSTVGPGSAGTVTAYAFQLNTKRAIISTLFSYTSTGTQQQVTYTVAATQAGFIAIRIRTDMTYKILKAEKIYVSPTVMDLSKNSEGGIAAYNPSIALFDMADFSESAYETGYVINADGTTSTTTDLTWRNYFIPVEKGDILDVVTTTGGSSSGAEISFLAQTDSSKKFVANLAKFLTNGIAYNWKTGSVTAIQAGFIYVRARVGFSPKIKRYRTNFVKLSLVDQPGGVASVEAVKQVTDTTIDLSNSNEYEIGYIIDVGGVIVPTNNPTWR
ncbi:phage tail fiber domain-containing protein, partial [Acinetobacter pittii]|uniref:phage tail fiber domain-containing protein n=1 Tax=Acinetobacter pittii TaxID=48296 RepID=UPI0025B0E22D